jgi:hypothetical protein
MAKMTATHGFVIFAVILLILDVVLSVMSVTGPLPDFLNDDDTRTYLHGALSVATLLVFIMLIQKQKQLRWW